MIKLSMGQGSWTLLGMMGGLVAGMGAIAPAAQAEPADVFRPHINEMVESVPPGYPIRLPSEIVTDGYILLNGRGDFDYEPLTVKVQASQTPLSLVVSLHSCEPTVTRTPCTFGTITIDRSSSVHAREELKRHQRLGDRITFRRDLRAHLIDGSRSGTRSAFSSVVWQQDNAIYTLSFPAAGDRQDLLDMAASMALSRPVRSTLPRSIPASLPQSNGSNL